jgi:hypothetical protein
MTENLSDIILEFKDFHYEYSLKDIPDILLQNLAQKAQYVSLREMIITFLAKEMGETIDELDDKLDSLTNEKFRDYLTSFVAQRGNLSDDKKP